MSRPDGAALCPYPHTAPYFANLGAAILRRLADLATWHEYAPGAFTFLEGDANTGLNTVHRGWVKVEKLSLDGREQVFRYFGAGEVCRG